MERLAEGLKDAEIKALELFEEVQRREIIRPGLTEKQVNDKIYELAFELFQIKRYWHKRIVRAGPNTLFPYRENPPTLTIKDDDILFLDFGPIFEEFEADVGRTYVLGDDPEKHRMKSAVESSFYSGKRLFEEKEAITGAELYAEMVTKAKEAGWEFGAVHSGHVVGKFPHESIPGEKALSYIHSDNPLPLRGRDEQGREHHWILEVHFVDRERNFGGFFEQLLTVKHDLNP